MKISKRYFILIAIIYIFALQFALMQKITVVQYWDEFYSFMCIPLTLMNSKWKIKNKKDSRYINQLLIALVLFILIGIVSNCVYQYQKCIAVLQDILINLKFFMGIATTYHLFKKFKISRYKKQIGTHAKVLITLFFLLVLQNKITHFFPVADMRFGISSEKLFFNHPTQLASATFFLLLMLMICYTNKKINILFIGMATIVVLSTLRFKAIATVMLFIYMYFIVVSGNRMKATYLLPLVPFIIVVAGDEFYFYFFSANAMNMARGALSFTSLKVASNTFPLGSGFGTFASWTSGIYYSTVYQLYGISGVWGLTKEWPQFVSDVFWPMVIAQNGYIGLILYFFIVFCLLRLIIQCSKHDKQLFLAGMGALSYLLVSSIAESAFVNPLALPLAFVIGLCICVYKQKERGIN